MARRGRDWMGGTAATVGVLVLNFFSAVLLIVVNKKLFTGKSMQWKWPVALSAAHFAATG